jgi:hypothetical protein
MTKISPEAMSTAVALVRLRYYDNADVEAVEALVKAVEDRPREVIEAVAAIAAGCLRAAAHLAIEGVTIKAVLAPAFIERLQRQAPKPDDKLVADEVLDGIVAGFRERGWI